MCVCVYFYMYVFIQVFLFYTPCSTSSCNTTCVDISLLSTYRFFTFRLQYVTYAHYFVLKNIEVYLIPLLFVSYSVVQVLFGNVHIVFGTIFRCSVQFFMYLCMYVSICVCVCVYIFTLSVQYSVWLTISPFSWVHLVWLSLCHSVV